MRTIGSIFGLALVSVALLAGCGGEARDATSKELSALTAEISKLRAQQSAMAERLETLERGKPKAAEVVQAAPETRVESAAATAAPRSLDSDRPSLDVVKLGPTAEADATEEDTDADGPRTVLRSGSNGIIVEETGPGGTTRTSTDGGAKKPAAKKSDKSDKGDRKKTAAVSTP